MRYQSANVSQLVIIICISLYYHNQNLLEKKKASKLHDQFNKDDNKADN